MAATNTFYRICSTDDLLESSPEPFAALVSEWVQLNESAATADAVGRWGITETALAAFSTVGEIPLFVDQADMDVKDDVLAALLRLAQAGESLAARTVLHCMLPGLRRLYVSRPMFRRGCERSGQRAGFNDDEAEHFLISECWMQIMRYPLDRRPRKIASNLYWDTKKNAITQPAGQLETIVAADGDFDFKADTDIEGEYFDSIGIEKFATDLSACIEWAQSIGAITHADAQLLTDTLVEHGMQRPTVTDPAGSRNTIYLTIAAEQGLSYLAVRKQVSRAKRRLVTAITENLLTNDQDNETPIFCAS